MRLREAKKLKVGDHVIIKGLGSNMRYEGTIERLPTATNDTWLVNVANFPFTLVRRYDEMEKA